MFLFAVAGFGAIFVGIFSAAYLLGLPSTAVLHSEPSIRTALSILGIILIAFALVALAVAALMKSKN